MKEKIKEFEKAAIENIEALRDELGAKRVNIEIHVDEYEKSCKTYLTFFESIPQEASCVPGCGPTCEGD